MEEFQQRQLVATENEETFKENVYMKIWNWHEIQDSDISEACQKNNIELYQKDVFEGAAWTCRVKK